LQLRHQKETKTSSQCERRGSTTGLCYCCIRWSSVEKLTTVVQEIQRHLSWSLLKSKCLKSTLYLATKGSFIHSAYETTSRPDDHRSGRS